MDLSLSEVVASKLVWRETVGSTNADLVEAVTNEDASLWPDFSVIATTNQTEGKGRLGRNWSAPAGSSLAVSVLLRPITPAGRTLPLESLGWMGLLAGLAMSRACDVLLPERNVQVKWPNDVVVAGKKLSGVLSELVNTPTGPAIVVGAGVNLTLESDQLPVPTATSLLLEGASLENLSVDNVLSSYLRELSRITNVFTSAAGNVRSSGLLDQVAKACVTIGQLVRVELPSGEKPIGTALGINEHGSLIVQMSNCAEPLVVSAGDVTHLRSVDRE